MALGIGIGVSGGPVRRLAGYVDRARVAAWDAPGYGAGGFVPALGRATANALRLGSAGKAALMGGLHLPGIAGNYVSTPDDAALTVGPDFRIEFEATLPDWSSGAYQCICAKMGAGATYSFALYLDGAGRVALYVSANGTAPAEMAVATALPFTNGQRGFVRVDFDADNGAAGRTVTASTSTDGVTYTTLGSVTSAGALAGVYDGATSLYVGQSYTAEPVRGVIHALRIYQGTSTLRLSWNPYAAPDFTSAYTDVGGFPWTLTATSGADTADPSVIAAGLSFGADDYVEVDNADGRFTPTSAMTFVFAGTVGSSTGHRVLGASRTATNIAWEVYRVSASTTLQAYFGGTTPVAVNFTGAFAAAAAEVGVWAVTLTDTAASLYKNGALVSTQAHAKPLVAGTAPLQICGETSEGLYNDGGALYHATVAAAAWSADEHRRHYLAVKSRLQGLVTLP